MRPTAPILSPRASYFRDRLHEYLPELRQHYGVSWLGLFGSHMRGEERLSSDLDVLVEFERTPDLLTFVALQNKLSDLLGVQVDLVMKRALRPSIGERVLQEVVEV